MKTKKQKLREKKHKALIALFKRLDAKGGARMAIWEEMENRTGYSREYITRVLRNNNIDYSNNSNKNGNQD